jgi:hypothetical protein
MTPALQRLPVTALAACVLGIVLCPVPYALLAARAEFTSFALPTTALPFAIGAAVLFRRLLRKPQVVATRSRAMQWVELASWVTVVSFLFFISQIHLLRGVQRWGAVSAVFLSASVCCLPLVWLRPTVIEQRLAVLPRALILTALCGILAVSGILLLMYLSTPTQFI